MTNVWPDSILNADCLDILPQIEENSAQLVIADPPYFRVSSDEWDNQSANEADYLEWSLLWIRFAMRALVPGGMLYCFGQTGKRE